MANGTPLVTVAGTPLPDPSTYNATTSTVVDSARNVQGVMVGSVIRDDIAKIEETWNFLTVEQWSDICKLFKTAVFCEKRQFFAHKIIFQPI